MDWSKAKNILILAFIVTNIFLAYVLFTSSQDKNELMVNNQLIKDVVKLLAKENIKVDTDIPKSTPSLPIISLEYEVYDPKEMLDIFLGPAEEISMADEYIYTNGKELLSFEENNKKLVYENTYLKLKKNKAEISKDEALKKVQEYIIDHKLNLKDARLNSHSINNKVHKLVYNKDVDGIRVEETNMTLKVSSDGVILFERYWVDNIKKGNENLIISSAPKALLRLLTREEYYGKTIKQIDICYYFNVDEYKRNISLNDSTGGVAAPTWRFIFEDGEKAFLEES